MRGLAALACIASSVALLAAGGASAAGPSIPFKGTATLKPLDTAKACGAKIVSAKVWRVGCSQLGSFTGQPSQANVNYGWTWDFPTDAKHNPIGPATEHGTLILNFGSPGLLYLSMAGKQHVVGKTTATSATAITTGTWAITKGTAAFVGRHGKGTYTFKTVRKNSANVFSLAQLKLNGSIT
jgi:hypothetical protein